MSGMYSSSWSSEDQVVSLTSYPGYGVSSDGRIWSHWERGGDGVPWERQDGSWTPMRHSVESNGYCRIELKVEGKKKRFLVHRLILEGFVGPCPKGMQCRHLDGNRNNNHLENLRWGTIKEDQEDKIRHGTYPRGSKNGRARLKESDVLEIIALRKSGMTHMAISKKFGVAEITIQKIIGGSLWKHVTR